MRIFCLMVLLYFCGSLYAESAANVAGENEKNENIVLPSVEPKNDGLISVEAKKSESIFPITKKSTLLPEIKSLLPENNTLLPESNTTTKPTVSALSNWPVVLLMLVGIVCLILGLAWFVKRFGGFSMTGGRDMSVLSSVSLGARERVALIDVKGQQFLVGVTTQNINHLHTFDEPVVDTKSGETSNSKAKIDNSAIFQKGDFAKKLQKLLTTAKPASDERV
jgi:flagellar protein FliO/FliZ